MPGKCIHRLLLLVLMVLLALQPSTVRLGAHADISSAARPSRALLLLLLLAAPLPVAGSFGGPGDSLAVGSRSWLLLLLLAGSIVASLDSIAGASCAWLP